MTNSAHNDVLKEQILQEFRTLAKKKSTENEHFLFLIYNLLLFLLLKIENRSLNHT